MKKERKRLAIVALIMSCVILISCGRHGVIVPLEYYAIKQYQPFLGETWCTESNFEKGNAYLLQVYNGCQVGAEAGSEVRGGCSAFRNGNFHGRNLDWFIRDYAMLVIHIPATEGRYASVGVVSSCADVNSSLIASGVVPDSLRDILPVRTTDGINEKGVAVNVNIILKECVMGEAGDVLWQREGYVPTTGNGGGAPVAQAAIPRYILDNCASVDEAIEKVAKLNVVEGVQGVLAAECLHFFVSDCEKSAAFEWYNNQFVVTEYHYDAVSRAYRSAKGMPAIMTNFYNCKLEEVYREGEDWYEPLYEAHPFAMGMERFSLIEEGLSEVNSLKAAENHISKVCFSRFYTSQYEGELWYTENAGFYGPYSYYPSWEGRISYWNEKMPGIVERYGSFDQQMQRIVGREDSYNWYTAYSIVYDLAGRNFVIRPQEGYYDRDWIRFTLDGR